MVFVQGEFQTQKEAAWAVSNLTISGNPQQVKIYSKPSMMPPPPQAPF